ncbi:MAG: transposase [Clostridiales bacterium]|nr:transposase [Clostridiales bacterium]
MGRGLRVEYEGAIYHVIQRGNNREYIFKYDGEKRYFLKKLIDYKIDMNFRLFGFVIMGNHYHLVLQTTGIPLQKIMHCINNSYSKFYNVVKERTGHVFGGRYKAIPVQDDRYILTLLRYVHQNPIRAGICEHVWEYPWSSDVFYRQKRDSFIDSSFILDILSNNRDEAVKEYKDFVQVEETNDYSSASVIGGRDFASSVSAAEYTGPRKRLDKILLETGISIDDIELIKSGSRKRYLAEYKALYVREALKQNYTLKQIAQHIGLSQSAVYKLANK